MTKSSSGVLASLRGSAYGQGKRLFPQSVGGRVRKNTLRLNTLGAHRPLILRAADLAAALLDGLSEQPSGQANDARDLRRDSISEVIT
ncbi:hypothetical protein W02_40890 [Nitrospira sp. KM1]|nr:hypothetical protein W02_40890 [Nitrospira sp. KM1]